MLSPRRADHHGAHHRGVVPTPRAGPFERELIPVAHDPATGQASLHCGRDANKDQSYVLFGIQRDLLGRILLPVGDYEKPDIRRFAEDAGLRVAQKKDSYEICFVPNDDYAGFLKNYRGHEGTEGDFVDPQGNVLGQHSGYEKFIVGQPSATM